MFASENREFEESWPETLRFAHIKKRGGA